MHNHCICEHALKYCAHCDIVYCTKCGREWSAKWAYTYYPQYTTTSNYCITNKDILDSSNCTHKV